MKKFLLVLLLTFSCVEHKFLFIISPNGHYQVEYKGHGNKDDLLDNDFTIPSSADWIISSTMDDVDVESFDYIAKREFRKNEHFPETFYLGDSINIEFLLKHPISVKYNNFFIFKKYYFEGKFNGRKVNQKYPLIEKLIYDIENPPNGWMKEALQFILIETLNQSNIDWNIKPIINSELNTWFENDLSVVSDSILFEDIDYYKNLGLDIIMQPASPKLYNNIDSVFNHLEYELFTTLDLLDDNFEFSIILPGEIISTNADSISGNNLFWSFSLQDYMNEDYKFSASSKIYHSERYKWIIIFILLLILFFIIIYNKK